MAKYREIITDCTAHSAPSSTSPALATLTSGTIVKVIRDDDKRFFRTTIEGKRVFILKECTIPSDELTFLALASASPDSAISGDPSSSDWDKRLDETLKAVGFQDYKYTDLLKQELEQGEMPEAFALGLTYGGGMLMSRADSWLVATNRRVIFLKAGMFRENVDSVPYSHLVTVDVHKGLMAGDISFSSHRRGSGISGLVGVPNKMIDTFVELCRKNIKAANVPVESDSHSSPDSLIAELERLAVLRDKGVLTEDEFQGQKARLLAAQPADPSLGLLCASCGITNSRNAKFCKECGAPIPPLWA